MNDSTGKLKHYKSMLAQFPALKKDEELELTQSLNRHRSVLFLALLDYSSVLLELQKYVDDPAKKYLFMLFKDELKDEEEERELNDSAVKAEAKKEVKAGIAKALKGESTPEFIDLVTNLGMATEDLYELVKIAKKGERSNKKKMQLEDLYKNLCQTRNTLINYNLRLVFSMVSKYMHKGLDLEDLLQEGNLGLMKAVDKFDVTKGYKFSTYATWWIRQAFGRALANKARTIRLPVHVLETIHTMARVQAEFLRDHDRAPSEYELAEKLDVPLDRLEYIRSVWAKTEIATTVTSPGDDTTDPILETVVDESQFRNPEQALEDKINRKILEEALAELNPIDEKVIRMRFGIMRGREEDVEYSFEEIAQKFQVSKQRIEQRERRGVRKLSQTLANHTNRVSLDRIWLWVLNR